MIYGNILLHLQSSEDSRFPGRGRTLSSTARDPTPPAGETDPNLHARLLEDSTPDRLSDATVTGMTEPIPAARYFDFYSV